MAQFARPIADLDNTGVWTTAPLWSKIDDAGDAGADSVFVTSDGNPTSAEPFTVDLSTVTDPGVSTGHIIRARWSKVSGVVNTRGVVQLRQGYVSEASPGTLIATLTGANLGTTLATQTWTLTTGETDAITDYADLQFRVWGEKNGGGAAAAWQVEYVELEVPDASIGPFTGTGTPTQTDDTAAGSGTFVAPLLYTGSGTPTQGNDTAAGSGTFVAPSYPGGIPAAAVIAYYDARNLAGSPTDPVSSWADTGPIGQDPLVQGTGSLQPFITDSGFGGVRSVESDGDDDRVEATFDQTYSGDYAIIHVHECLTFPAKAASAGVTFSTGSVPNKVIHGYDDQGPSGHVFMVTGGDPADHETATLDLPYMEATPSRYVTIQYLQNAGPYKVWENGAVLLDYDEGEALNNMPGVKLFIREDNSRPAHARVAVWMAVRMDGVDAADEADLVAAGLELMADFNVTSFSDHRTGSGAPTQGDDVAAGAGTFVAPVYTGSGAPAQDDQTAAGVGVFTGPVVTGAGAPAQADDVAAGAGTFTVPAYEATGSAVEEDDVAAGTGTFVAPVYTGAGAPVQEDQTSAGSGTASAPGTVTGTGAPTQADDVASGSGTFVAPPTFTGSGTPTQEDETSSGSGTFTAPAYTGSGAPTQEDQVSAGSATFTPPATTVTGSGAPVQADNTATGTGTFTGLVVPYPLRTGHPSVARTLSGSARAEGEYRPGTTATVGPVKPTKVREVEE